MYNYFISFFFLDFINQLWIIIKFVILIMIIKLKYMGVKL